jgi:pSer/pThr/pTyr-binding forkhead associated (FHA) protein
MNTKLTLHAVRGPVAGEDFCLMAPGSYVIGRSLDCDLSLPGTGTRFTSRHHCRVQLIACGAFVQDLGSRNGTFLNGKRIGHRPADQRPAFGPFTGPGYPLADGDELSVGDTMFRVVVAGEAGASKSAAEERQPEERELVAAH